MKISNDRVTTDITIQVSSPQFSSFSFTVFNWYDVIPWKYVPFSCLNHEKTLATNRGFYITTNPQYPSRTKWKTPEWPLSIKLSISIYIFYQHAPMHHGVWSCSKKDIEIQLFLRCLHNERKMTIGFIILDLMWKILLVMRPNKHSIETQLMFIVQAQKSEYQCIKMIAILCGIRGFSNR